MNVAERLEPLFERVRDQLASMTERDRRILVGGLLLVGLGIVFGGIWQMKSSLDARERRLTERVEALNRIGLLSVDLAEIRNKSDQISARIAEHESTDVSAYLEQVAQRSNVSDRLDSVRQKTTAETGSLVETVYAVKLSRLTQEELATFLYEMESTGYPLKVRMITVKARKRAEETTLNVDMDISAYKLIASSGEE